MKKFSPSFYEMIQIYGITLKALVPEQFGDGSMAEWLMPPDPVNSDRHCGGH